ncbi:hypothetical protein ACFW04_004168 [Cataglyphis niger]
MAQHPRLRPHFAAMLQNRRSAVPSCHAASSYYSATAMANESAPRMRLYAHPQPNCRQRRSTKLQCVNQDMWCQQQHGSAS